MASDISRIRSNPLLDVAGVTLKQGGVVLDADVNELVDVLDRRLRALASDVLGRSTVSQTTPNAFKLSVLGGMLMIAKGRLYVDGLLAENHGAASTAAAEQVFDALMAEPAFLNAIRHDQQPYLPPPPASPPLPTSGRHLVYLDVWQRELTHLERPGLVEVAVGVETSARLQTVWQVKVLADDAANATCGSPDADLPGWAALTAPSSARLSTGTFTPPASPDPCELPPSGDYQGLENQTYRVEIHDAGQPGGSASFKWSRENASVGSRVEAIVSATELQLQTLGRDEVLGLATGDWVEIVDEHRELLQRPGEMRRISVNTEARRISFTPALPADLLPPSLPDPDFPAARHLRVRRWDQKGKVLEASATTPLFHDLDAPGASGAIPVPPAGTTLMLEHGVTVRFDSAGTAGLRSGDFWVFAARTADASVELLTQAPPRGIHHHYARLGLWTVGAGDPTDCRTPWPPRGEGHDCSCTECVTPESQASGAWTIQAAVDRLRDTGGTVCLGVGSYALAEPVRLNTARSVRIRGQGSATLVVSPGAAFEIRQGLGLAIEDLMVLSLGQVAPGARSAAAAINAATVLGLSLQRLIVAVVGDDKTGGTAIGLSGAALGVTIRDNTLLAPVGVAAPVSVVPPGLNQPPPPVGLLGALRIEHNQLWCERSGVLLSGAVIHALDLHIHHNQLLGCRSGGVLANGLSLPSASSQVSDNWASVSGPGLVLGLDGLRAERNQLAAAPQSGNTVPDGPGLWLLPGLNPAGLARVQLLDNQITGFTGAGIRLGAPVAQLLVKLNLVSGCGQGIVADGEVALDQVAIENNQLRTLGGSEREAKDPVVGIELARAARAAVVGNGLGEIGQAVLIGPYRAGIACFGTLKLRVDGNQVDAVGPTEEFNGLSAGVLVSAPFQQVDVAHNQVEREALGGVSAGKSDWQALRVLQAGEQRATARMGVHALVALDTQRSLVFGLARPYIAETGAREDTSGASRLGNVSVQGNALQARGATPAVQVDAADDLLFSDNRVALSGNGQPAVRLQGNAMVVSSNRVRGGEASLELLGNLKRATVLGNLTSGAIVPALFAPWDALNVRG